MSVTSTLTRSESNIKLECIAPTQTVPTIQLLRNLGVWEERKEKELAIHFQFVGLLRKTGRMLSNEPCDH